MVVQILGHAGRILRSYLHDLCDHGIQTFYHSGRGPRIYFSRALFGCYNTQNCRVHFFTGKSLPMGVNVEFIIWFLPPMMESIVLLLFLL
jgi:hypothetical protein